MKLPKAADVWNTVHDLKPAILMVAVYVAYAGLNVTYKLAVNDGMNLKVVVAYRFIFASAFMVPLALILERQAISMLLSYFHYCICISYLLMDMVIYLQEGQTKVDLEDIVPSIPVWLIWVMFFKIDTI